MLSLMLYFAVVSHTMAEAHELGEDDEVTCDMVLPACNDALEAADKALKDSERLVNAQREALAASRRREKELMAERDFILRNPWFWGVVGAGLGVGGVILIRKF